MLSFLKEKILAQPTSMITYADFMELALYHHHWGYYMRPIEKVGRKGDFITTSNISDIYGRIIAKWFLKLQKEKGLPPAVCEIGAGNGRFADAFIDEWRKNSNEALKYYIVETSPYHRELQRDVLPVDDCVIQIEDVEELKPFNGFIFSNELFDALPVHVIEKKKGDLMEVMVSFENGQLTEKLSPLNNEQILGFLKESKLHLQDNQRIEISLQMEAMIRRIANTLERGIVVTVDYGYTNEEWMEPIHRDGSLRGYYQHEQVNNVLLNPGEMDITTHIHLDSFSRIGEKYGLKLLKKQRQDEFLMSIGILQELENHYDPNPFSETSRRNRAIRSLIIPSGISAYFHAIIQSKE